MLVLTRRVGEEVMIGDSIRVKIVAIRGHQVRLGLVAPDQVRMCPRRAALGIPLKRG